MYLSQLLQAWLVLLPLTLVSAALADYHEQLVIRPLPRNALLSSFNFRSNVSADSFDKQDFRHFPRSFGQILQHTHTKELHLRFSFGRWDAESWGERPWNGSREGGTGVELWAWLEGDSIEEANARWLTLTNALSGLFCASLNFIDATRTIRPVNAFSFEGVHSPAQQQRLHLLHGTLPHEVVCTENLTPFLKLLPCKGKAGISSLLDGHKVFDASWQSMAIDVRPMQGTLQIEQTIDMVLDIARSKRPRDNPIPRPIPIEDMACDTSKGYNSEDTCFPLEDRAEANWSFAEVFGKNISGSCSLERQEEVQDRQVCLETSPEREVHGQIHGSDGFEPLDPAYDQGYDILSGLKCWNLPSNGYDFDLTLPRQGLQSPKPSPPRVYASRSITGYGQERGGLHAVLTNPSDATLKLVYMESLPWYMKPYLHTLQADVKTEIPSIGYHEGIKQIHYRPALDRLRGTHLELQIELPPKSTLTLSYDFEKAILRYTEYPPDANRGFDVAPAVIKVLGDSPAYVRTTSLLLPLPTPDFSMPYNVIILTSTVMALGFGGFFNLLVRRFVAADEIPPTKMGLAIARLRARVQFFKQRLLATVKGKVQKTE